ncbi:MAG TPA: type II toxin-antitoxin system PemK/MazF family toxin [Candidatus Paceibacterota bacterium]
MNVFDEWNAQKKRADETEIILGFKERELWFIKMGKNVGFEQDGKGDEFLRPVLIFKKFNTRVFWGIPLTRTEKKGPFYYQLANIGQRRNTAILSQIRLFDAKRLKYKIGTSTAADFEDLKKSFQALVESAGKPRNAKPPHKTGEARRRL